MRVILVPVADRPESKVALDAAFGLAGELGGNVVGCHVRPHRDDEIPGHGYLMPDRAWAWTRETEDPAMHCAAARELFASLARQHGFSEAKRARLGQVSLALWKEMVGTPSRIFGIIGPVADLAVLSRPKAKSSGPAEAFLLSALLNSSKPVLVLPQRRRASVGKRVLIAWNQSAEAAATVSASLPLLQKAEQLTIASSGAENRPGPKSSYLAEYLAHWGIRTRRVSTRGRNVERELADTFRETESDLLLMGAYSRPRLRQLVFGGVTETMLFKTDCPVLMLHR
jgi:nucleotide-binding universal stress UspA family protein